MGARKDVIFCDMPQLAVATTGSNDAPRHTITWDGIPGTFGHRDFGTVHIAELRIDGISTVVVRPEQPLELLGDTGGRLAAITVGKRDRGEVSLPGGGRLVIRREERRQELF